MGTILDPLAKAVKLRMGISLDSFSDRFQNFNENWLDSWGAVFVIGGY